MPAQPDVLHPRPGSTTAVDYDGPLAKLEYCRFGLHGHGMGDETLFQFGIMLRAEGEGMKLAVCSGGDLVHGVGAWLALCLRLDRVHKRSALIFRHPVIVA